MNNPESGTATLSADFPAAERDMLVRMGVAVVALWSELPRDLQRVLFEAAAGKDKSHLVSEGGGGLREKIARFLHDNGNPHDDR